MSDQNTLDTTQSEHINKRQKLNDIPTAAEQEFVCLSENSEKSVNNTININKQLDPPQEDTASSTNNNHTNFTTSSEVSILPSLNLEDVLKSLPIYFFLWNYDGSIIPLDQPVKSLPPINIQHSNASTNSTKTQFYPQCLPKVTVEQIITAHQESLPLDKLPGEFLESVSKEKKGVTLVALQFVPSTSSTCATSSTCTTTTTDVNENNNNTAQSTSPQQQYQTHVVGLVTGLLFQFWSRMADAVFQLKKILNIFSIFVSPLARRRGVASTLLDTLYMLYQSWNTTHKQEEQQSLSILDKTTSEYLLSLQLPQIEEISLEVRATNTSAQALYKTKGFIKQNEEKEYYELGVNKRDRTMYEMVVTAHDYKVGQYNNDNN